jgi:serine/threonine protein phosphatase
LKIEKINEDDYERIFLTSDIHGHYSMFEELLDKIKLTKKDLLIILGDSCDRGPKTYELYKKYYDLEKEGYNIKHLRGNHEDMLIKAMESGDNDHWYRNGGEKTQKSFYNNSESKDTLTFEEWLEREGIKSVKWFVDWLDRIPIMISGKKNLFVHAAFDTTKSEDEQEHRFLIWDRNDFWTNNKTGKAIYFGHTPSKDGKIKHYVNDVHCIDTGSYKNGIIACVELKTGKEIYIKDKENKKAKGKENSED